MNKPKRIKAKKVCGYCNKEFKSKGVKYCSKSCKSRDMSPESKIPDKQVLVNDFKELIYFTEVGKKYSVSDNTIRKWCKKYNITK